MWPSTNRDDVKTLISSLGGFKKFYSDCFPLIVNKDIPESHWNDYSENYPREWYEDEGETVITSPSDFVSIVDVRFKDKTVRSEVLWGIPNADGFDGWFYDCPFRVDLLENDEIALPPIRSVEGERKDGKLWRELRDGTRLSWILVNRKTRKAANLSSWAPIGGQRHWPTDRDFVLRFGSVLPAKNILPCRVVECILIMRFRAVVGGEGDSTVLRCTELSMKLGDMEGSHVNGRNSLLVLREAVGCARSKNYGEAIESCLLYSKAQSEMREEKMRYENRLDTLWIVGSIVACLTFCLYCL
ncbi:F-box protein at3g44326 [Phtheirospermum japonicum]|uniref:F-box protein at3g44326 n=1 Tax=Phtheirospermum japonicum TaxID=374723 RepID=A0A830CPL7_9LAMI|nr:F-box protein at3g44326 [Phtheirospermum japonicum]